MHAFTPIQIVTHIVYNFACSFEYVCNKQRRCKEWWLSYISHVSSVYVQTTFSSSWLVEICRKDVRDHTRARREVDSFICVWKKYFLWWRCLIMMFHLSFFRPQHATSFFSEFIMFIDDVFHLLLVRGESFSDLQRSFLNTSFAPPLLIVSSFPLPFIFSQHPFNISVHQMGYKKIKGCSRM